jgi:hypothetical protein
MADSHAHDGFIIVNVFTVVPSAGGNGKYEDPIFIKRGLMPINFLVGKVPMVIDDLQYNFVDVCYELGHREAMVFVAANEALALVKGAGKATVPDVARYGASAH